MDRDKALGLLSNETLFSAVINYNNCQKSLLPKEYEAFLDSDTLLQLVQSTYLKKYLEKNKRFYSFDKPIQRLVLVDDETIQSLLKYLGACANVNTLQSLVLKEDLETLFKIVDLKVYDFVMTYGRFALSKEYKAPIVSLDALKASIETYGEAILRALASDFENEALANIFNQRLSALGYTSYDGTTLKANSLFNLAKTILCNEIDAKWKEFFK